MKRILLISIVSFSFKGMLVGGVINVPSDYLTIQAALNAADSSDTVLVQPGTYFENIFWPDKNGIKLISAGDSSNTIIDGGGISSVIYMNPVSATIDTTTLIQGFKIINGGNVANGGGLFVSGASPIITQMWLTGNSTTTGHGGGIYIEGDAILSNIDITSNYSGAVAGGLYVVGDCNISRVRVYGNIAYGSGGGILLDGNSTVVDLIVANNESQAASCGGMCISGDPMITAIIVEDNVAFKTGGGIFLVEIQR